MDAEHHIKAVLKLVSIFISIDKIKEKLTAELNIINNAVQIPEENQRFQNRNWRKVEISMCNCDLNIHNQLTCRNNQHDHQNGNKN